MRKDIAFFLWFVLVLPVVGKADTYHDNLRTCLGGYPALCNHALLSTEHAQQVQMAEYETNLRTCLGGYPALCNHALLSTEHTQQVQKAEYETNLRTCLGGYPALCNHALLSKEHAQQVQMAEYGKSASTEIYEASPSKYSSTVPVTKTQNQPYVAPGYNSQQPHPSDAPPCAENGSCNGDISPITGVPKTVHVHGYFRRDGTYVRGHYRSHR